MLYQLPNGKVIEISVEQYLDMTDEDLEYLIAYNHGETIENPWFGSALSRKSPTTDDIEDLLHLPPEEKLSDPDFSPED